MPVLESVSGDAKLTSRLTGQRLYWLLLVGLGAVAFGADLLAGRLVQPTLSLTVPLWVTTVLVTMMGRWAVPLLRSLKAGQVFQSDGPQSHLKKVGTPTMGGIFFVPVALLVSVIWTTATLPQLPVTVFAAALLTLLLGFVGWVDDWQVLRKKSNQGMSARLRLAIELGSGLGFGLWLMRVQPSITTLQFPLGLTLPLGGLLFLVLAVFVVAAESNAVNLTDGMDGLAPGTCAIALLGMALIVAPNPELMVFCACMTGGCLGFLAHNYNPARVFMGDTGSLALGGALAAVGLISNSLWALLLVSGLFLAEALSVIAQVAYYKRTKGPDGVGKRLLRMAPLHHHFEESGWPEIRVVSTFYGVVVTFAAIALVLDKLG